jgi:hypothetical protein
MYLSILALPMFGSAIAGLRGRSIGVTGAHIITTGCLTTSALLAMVAFYEVGLCGSPVSIELFSWIDSEFMLVNWGFLFDSLTVSMLLPVLVVSSLVHLYSISYMAEDPHNQRFFSYLSMFTFFMLILVAGDNYFIMFIGWEGIGISSYLLINFWYTRIQANKSGIKALTVNRVGDMFLSVGFFAIFWVFGNVDYATVFSVAPFINESAITIIGLLLLVGAMAKSAQIGLHTWLPDKPSTMNFVMMGVRYFSNSSVHNKNPGKRVREVPPLSDFLLSFLIGLMVSGRLAVRHHFNNQGVRTARLQMKLTTTTTDKDWLNYLYSLLAPYCNNTWSVAGEVDTRKQNEYVTTRATLVTQTLELFYPLFDLFFMTPRGKGLRSLTKANLVHFNEVSLAAFVMACGFHLSLASTAPFRLRGAYTDGLILPVPSEYLDEEVTLLQERLSDIGVKTVKTLSRKRVHRANWLLVVPNAELANLDAIIGKYLIPSKKHLTKVS